MRPAEEGMLLLCSTLSEPGAQPLSGAEFQALREKLAGQLPQEDPLQELTQGMLLRAGLSEQEAGRVLALLSRGERLSAYLAAAQRQGMSLVTRISPGYPARLRAGLGDDAPPVLYCKGDPALLSRPALSVVGARHVSAEGRRTAQRLGAFAAEHGLALCSGGANGADLAAQEACLRAGGTVVSFPATRLLDLPADGRVLYAVEDGFGAGFSAGRALHRNRLIHAFGLAAAAIEPQPGRGGTWSGSVYNLAHGLSPLFVSDDGSAGAQALLRRGARPLPELAAFLRNMPQDV